MTGFFVVVVLLGFLLSRVMGSPMYLYIAFALSLVMNIAGYWFSDKMVLKMAGATPIESKADYPELWNSVENLSITAGLPMPKLYVIDDPAPNAFATGRNPKHAVIAVTTGLLPLLNKSELEVVLAHELSHDETLSNSDKLATILDFDKVFGLGLEAFTNIIIPEEIIALAEVREFARKEKDFVKSDALRKEIEDRGYILKDTENGYKVDRKI